MFSIEGNLSQSSGDLVQRVYLDLAGASLCVTELLADRAHVRPEVFGLLEEPLIGLHRKDSSNIRTKSAMGIHDPISPESFNRRVDEWHRCTGGAEFFVMDYEEAMEKTREGDLIYCDPPYRQSQTILYGAQDFDFAHLLDVIERCKARGVNVALSIDGMKRSGNDICSLPIPEQLFERAVFISCGRSMLKRFQMNGLSLEGESVTDRLFLTY